MLPYLSVFIHQYATSPPFPSLSERSCCHMETKDHLILADAILSVSSDPILIKNRSAFTFGCVEPDYNPLTYLRGIVKHKNFYGHHASHLKPYILNSISSFKAKGIHSVADCFFLGTLTHYISDSFTYPHTEQFVGSINDHVDYEKKFHLAFSERIHKITADFKKIPSVSSWSNAQKLYLSLPPSVTKDLSYISSVCLSTVSELLSASLPLQSPRCSSASSL